MGEKNYLIEGVSGTGKSSVYRALRDKGYVAIDGDTELAYQGNPETGIRTEGLFHEQHIWDVDKVKRIIADKSNTMTFFCGGSRNFAKFIGLFDGVFILDVDVNTLNKRLDSRQINEWGNKQSERELILKLHATKEDIPQDGYVIDATQSIDKVVDEIVAIASRDTSP